MSWASNQPGQVMREITLAQLKMHSVLLPSQPNSSSKVGKGDVAHKMHKLFLFKLQAPPTWVHKPVDTKITHGSSVEIVCSATGQPSPQITWTKNQGTSEPNFRLSKD